MGVKGRLPAAERLRQRIEAIEPSPKPRNKPRKGRPLTMQEIESQRSSKGGYTRKIVTAWGVPWPLVSGWKQRLIRGDYD